MDFKPVWKKCSLLIPFLRHSKFSKAEVTSKKKKINCRVARKKDEPTSTFAAPQLIVIQQDSKGSSN